MILSTHILPEVEATCSRAVILIDGRIRADGKLDRADPLPRSGGQRRAATTRERLRARLFERLPGVSPSSTPVATARSTPSGCDSDGDRGDRRGGGPTSYASAAGRPARAAPRRQDAGAGFPRVDRGRAGGGGMNRVRVRWPRASSARSSTHPSPTSSLLAFVGAALVHVLQRQRLLRPRPGRPARPVPVDPLLTLLLVPALTMRLWAEEEKQGTIEVAADLPAKDHELVGGQVPGQLGPAGRRLAADLPLPGDRLHAGQPGLGAGDRRLRRARCCWGRPTSRWASSFRP